MKAVVFPTLKHLREYMDGMLDEHYAELCTDKRMVLNPDWDRYNALDDQGLLIMTGVFDGALCVGYEMCFMQPHIHYKDTVVAWSDVLLVRKAYRDTSAGGRLMLATAAACKARGAHKLLRHAKPGTALDRMMASRKPPFEHVYAQEL